LLQKEVGRKGQLGDGSKIKGRHRNNRCRIMPMTSDFFELVEQQEFVL